MVVEDWIDLLDKKLCEKCIDEREDLISEDSKEYIEGKYRSDKVLGFSSEPLTKYSHSHRPDVFIILESYGGGESWTWHSLDKKTRWKRFEKGERSWKKCSEDLKTYYLEKKIDSYHQKIIRELIQNIQMEEISYFVSDLVKCYVDKNGKNFRIACKQCRKVLKKQIEDLKPPVIVSFGAKARDFLIEEYLNNIETPKLNEEGVEEFEVHSLKGIPSQAVIYPFPSKNNANSFEIFGGLHGYKYDDQIQRGLLDLVLELLYR